MQIVLNLERAMKCSALFLVLCLLHQGWSKEASENKTFVPTKDWQEIPEGQGIPAGLHVRINLETGKKEAKVLDDSDESTAEQQGKETKAALSVVPETSTEDPDKKNAKPHKKVKHLDEALERIGIDYTPKEKVENIIREYKSYEELKKNFEGMRKSFKSDSEIIMQLIEEFRTSTSTADSKNGAARVKAQLQILESFNYLLSQYDNALIFADRGGLEQVLLPVIVNTTQSSLKVEAMRVLGAMSQNNLRAQIKVFERNVGSYLSQIIMTSTNTDELSSALYAFSSLLRKFPLAQQKILSTSGTQALLSVLNRDCELKIKIKAIILISNLLEERKSVLSTSSAPEDPLAAAQYAEIALSAWLMDHNYCEILSTIVKDNARGFIESPDFLEYVVYSLNNESDLCASMWSKDAQLMEILQMLKKGLFQSENKYHLEVAQSLDQFLKKTFGDGEKSHDEL